MTSLLVPLLLVLFRVILDKDGLQMAPPAATKLVILFMLGYNGPTQNGLQICFLGYVFTDYHVTHWGFHYLIGFKQDQYRSCLDYTRPKFGRYTTK